MSRAARFFVLCLFTAACGGDDDSASTARVQTPTVYTPSDAGTVDGQEATTSTKPEGLGKYHLDTGGKGAWKPRRGKAAPPRILRLTLRTSPPGAMAHVDGTPIGVTPTYWEGPATGKPRDFVFTLRDHAMARYRFVPVTDGIVHGQLRKLVTIPPDAGAAEVAPPTGDGKATRGPS
jgi:hypothetical protein